MFYQDELYLDDDKYLTLDANQGIDYFMEDWMSYCNKELDEIILINVSQNKVRDWRANKYTTINGNNPYDIASQIALHDWSYSKNAVIAVIDEEFDEKKFEKTGAIKGTLVVNKDVKSEHFEIPQTNKLNPVPNEFTVPEGYEYIDFRCWYSCISIKLGLPLPGAESLAKITIPAGDKDLQVYCYYDNDWMQIEALAAWNQKEGMDREKGGSYVYENGRWMVQVTDVPTKGSDDKKIQMFGTPLEILKNFKQVIYQVDVNMYPGERFPIFDSIPFDCKDVKIELESKNANVNLGYSFIGPGGEEILADEEGVIEVHGLGQLLPGETYDIVVYTMDDAKGSFDYDITYSWMQDNNSEYKADCLTDATEGAVLASMLNAPLLYTSPSKLPSKTKDALYKLGVENIYLINLGGHLKQEALDQIKEIDVKPMKIEDHKTVYDKIRSISNSNDIIFATVEPWTPWYVAELKPTDEMETPGALHLGPAAYVAAHHGAPVLVVDNHPRLSSSIIWHTEFWRRHANGHVYPSVAEMYLTGRRVHEFLKEYEFDKEGMETMITVADQYEIGAPWDRVFVGLTTPGRFCGPPVDTAYWIARNMFYPALIFENPAMDSDGVDLINGTMSHRRTILPWGKGGLKIDRDEQTNTYTYPVLASLIGHKYRLNENMENYYGSRYHCADGIIPGVDISFNPIDDGTMLMSTGELGEIWPDMSTTEIIPFYLNRGGYSTAFTTNFDATIENLNSGVLLWIVNSHGADSNSGTILFWDPNNQATSEQAITGFPGLPFVGATKEPNPWRGYDWYLGSTENPDTMTIEIYGIIPALLGNPNPKLPYIFRTALDWAPAKKPILDKIGTILGSIPIIKHLVPDWLVDTHDYYDGLIISSMLSKFGCSWYKGTYFDEKLENLHSMGLVTSACLIAYKYLHTTIVRHGSAYQVVDPWATSWYSSFWLETIPRDIILGDTIGEAYVKGMSHVGILYVSGGGPNKDQPQWWWDIMENVCFFGDPDLRVYVPDTNYNHGENKWEQKDTRPLKYDEEITINGHMPFGATSHPKEKQPQSWFEKNLFILVILGIVILLVIAVSLTGRKK